MNKQDGFVIKPAGAQSRGAEGGTNLSVGLATDKRKVLANNPDAYLYMSYAIYHIAESTRQCAPSIGSGNTEAEAWAEAANDQIQQRR